MMTPTLGEIVALALGAVIAWNVGRALERFRRARGDFRAARAGIRTLIEMMMRRGWEAARWTLIGAAAVAVIILAVSR